MSHIFKHASLRRKVSFQIIALLTSFLIVYLLVMLSLVREQVHSSMQSLLEQRAVVLQEKIEQQFEYLLENTTLLASHQLMINALTDTAGRKKYLPPLVSNFQQGKDVLSLNVVDYAGHAIYQTQTSLPEYNDSSGLRHALAYRKTVFQLYKDQNNIQIISPIEYYSTTQGALLVVFDLKAIVDHQLADNEEGYIRIRSHDQVIYQTGFEEKLKYVSHIHNRLDANSLFKQLNIQLEIGEPESLFNAQVWASIYPLIALGILLIIISTFFASHLGTRIVSPILELNRRVKSSSKNREVFCSPIGTEDELEDLAKAFDERTLELQHQAEHDSLTSLPNRVLFLDRLQQAIKLTQGSNQKLAILFIDLDRFKEVNDSFGHDMGDELLQVVSDSIQEVLRASDSIARLGGDEFAVLINQVNDQNVIVSVLEKILTLFKEPFTLNYRQIFTTCSIGVAVCPENGVTAENLLRNADAAMYKAKEEGRNNYQFYTQDMTKLAYDRLMMENDLRVAIRNNAFELFYHVQTDMRTQQLIGVECLIRWFHSEKGFIPPDKFIGLAEETGLIVPIDRWVLTEAMAQYQRWQKQGLDIGVMSVNLSAVQLAQRDFISFVEHNLHYYEINPTKLMFEVTETAIMRSPEQSVEILNKLKGLGVGLALDDFGTGLSSLSYLKKLPIDKIKIDRAFIKDIPEDEEDMSLTKTIIAMAENLNLQLIAEGVETEPQIEFLIKSGCHHAQGYFYHKPCNSKDMSEILKGKESKVIPIKMSPLTDLIH